jgi:hypothetical protein
MKRITLFFAKIGVFFLFQVTPVFALFGSGGLDPGFCQIKSVRQTVVYIDDMLMIEGKTDWANKLVGKLKASLSPGERTTVVRLSPNDGHSYDVWSGCWPDFSSDQKTEISKQIYLLKKNPLDGLQEQQGYFIRDFGVAVSKIYAESKRQDTAVKYTPGNAPNKQILRALASDEGRFANSPVTVRAIIYSDMAENSDLGSVFKPLPMQPLNYAEKLGTHLRKSVFYSFGVGEDINGGQSMQENAKAFWSSALKMMSATIGGFGADLNVSNRIPVKSFAYDLTLKFDKQDLDGKLFMLIDDEGNIVDSLLGFQRLGITGLTGTFRCVNEICKLDGATTSNLTTNRPAEDVSLLGKSNQLSGELGIKGTDAIFSINAIQSQ